MLPEKSNRKHKIFTPGIFAALLGVALISGCETQRYVHLKGYAQGGTWSVKYNTSGVKMRPTEVQKGIEAILQDVDTTLSGYNKRSQLSRLNAGDTITPSGMLREIYKRSYNYWVETEGAVDIAAGPVFDIWGFGFKNDSLPDAEQIRKALAISGMGHLVPTMEEALMPDGRICAKRLIADYNTKKVAGRFNPLDWQDNASGSPQQDSGLPQLNFNAVAQGYSCDTVARFLASIGAWDMLVDIGEIWCRGFNPKGQAWKVGIDRPVDGNISPGSDLSGIWQSETTGNGQGIVTSGNYRKFYIRDGVKYSHTINPKTGYPANNTLLSASIVAPTAEAADAYATYCMVIGLEASQQFIASRPDLEGCLIFSNPDGSMSEWRSEDFNLLQQ
ncbi:MAG: FAD:protein FMN transferase [Candidatus Cryptobacteroides sp.]|jgi:thiamine biosynthesis lipoprotein